METSSARKHAKQTIAPSAVELEEVGLSMSALPSAAAATRCVESVSGVVSEREYRRGIETRKIINLNDFRHVVNGIHCFSVVVLQ